MFIKGEILDVMKSIDHSLKVVAGIESADSPLPSPTDSEKTRVDFGEKKLSLQNRKTELAKRRGVK